MAVGITLILPFNPRYSMESSGTIWCGKVPELALFAQKSTHYNLVKRSIKSSSPVVSTIKMTTPFGVVIFMVSVGIWNARAKHTQGVRHIRKAAKPPTAVQWIPPPPRFRLRRNACTAQTRRPAVRGPILCPHPFRQHKAKRFLISNEIRNLF